MAVPVIGEICDLANARPMVVSAGQQQDRGRRSHHRGVKSGMGDAFLGKPRRGWRGNGAANSLGLSKPESSSITTMIFGAPSGSR
jgi:hypothetical protein